MEETALKRRLEGLAEEHKRVRAELRQNCRRLTARGNMTDWKWKVGRAIILLSDGHIAAGVAYVLLGKSDVGQGEVQEYHAKFQAWWSSTTPQSREDTVLKPQSAQGVAALARARKVTAEQDLVRWVAEVNLKYGIAPDSRVLNTRRAPAEQVVSGRTRTQWARRWRFRWSIGLGRLAARERLSAEVKQCKALAMWQWAYFLNSQVPSGKQPLRINMDETCIRLYQRGKVGHLILEAMKQKKQGDALSQNVTLGQQRSACTLVALITDCQAAQPYLPQMIIASERTMTAAERAALREDLPENIVLHTGKNAWMNGDVFKVLVDLLTKRLARFKDTHQIIFTADTYPCHITKESLACCGRHGVWPHLVPAKMTWALQPLDTHVFAKFKSHLASTWQRMQICGSNPDKLEWRTMICAVAETVQDVIGGQSWEGAFAHTGLSGQMLQVSEHVLEKVGMTERPVLTSRLPSALELEAMFPKSCVDLPIDELFGAWTGRYDRGDGGEVERRRGEWRDRRIPVAVPLWPWLRPPKVGVGRRGEERPEDHVGRGDDLDG